MLLFFNSCDSRNLANHQHFLFLAVGGGLALGFGFFRTWLVDLRRSVNFNWFFLVDLRRCRLRFARWLILE